MGSVIPNASQTDMLLPVRDVSATGQSLHEIAIEFLTERITVRELVQERVRQEVQYFNRKVENEFQGHLRVQELDEQVRRAWEGFTSNSYFILIDDKQAESLEQEFPISPITRISFVKLTPLVGG
jgi:hypothetical protein